jgi:hypothetical protein
MGEMPPAAKCLRVLLFLRPRMGPTRSFALASVLLFGCDGLIRDPAAQPSPGPRPTADAGADAAVPSAPFSPGNLTFPRLTNTQYRNALTDLFGLGLTIPASEPDTNPYLFTNIGASLSTASQRGVEGWERTALSVTQTVFADPARRSALVGCEPDATDACARAFLQRFIRRAWRRPPEAEELSRYVALARATTAPGEPWSGLRYATAGALQSPNFVYRVELGVENNGRRKYTAHEMASRLSFALWDSIPDDELATAADNGSLATEDGVRTQAERMLRSPRARAGVRAFFVQYLGLSALDHLSRDAAQFPQFTVTVAESMRKEVELDVEDVIFTQDTDFRLLFSQRQTFVNPELAQLYNIPYPAGGAGFVRVALPESSQRGGLLTTAGVLAITSHQNATSPTARGRYVSERLRCEHVPDPPGNIQFNIDQPASGPRLTLRQRLARHRENPACAACHVITDPLGLGFENFDALGALRTVEEGMPVDASGEIDGRSFVGARALGERLSTDPRLARCLVKQVYRFAQGRLDTEGEAATLALLTRSFEESGFRFKRLLVELFASEGFRFASTPSL